MIDTHAHLDQEEFSQDLPEVLARAQAAGVQKIIAVGVTLTSSQAVLALAQQHTMVYAAAGIHPNYAVNASPEDWDHVAALCKHERVAAIGETGLDKHWDFTPWETQVDYFRRHLSLSRQTGLPLVIHTRDCEIEMLAELRQDALHGPLKGVMHSFAGDAAMAAACLELGLYVSFSGMLTYKKSSELRETAKTIPLDRLLLETDSPYLSPHPKRGGRNEPAHVMLTLAALAEARGTNPEELARVTSQNAQQLFRLK